MEEIVSREQLIDYFIESCDLLQIIKALNKYYMRSLKKKNQMLKNF